MPPHWCPTCESCMSKEYSTGRVVFVCKACTTEEVGGPVDALIFRAVLGTKEVTGKHQRLIQTAEHDRTNQQVMKECSSCGLDHMAQIRLGASEVVIYKCECGAMLQGGAAAAL